MPMKRMTVWAGLVLAASLGLADRAQATYTYSTVVTGDSATNGATISNTATGTTITLDGTSITLTDTSHGPFFVPGQATLDASDITLTSTVPLGPTGTSFSFNYTVNLTLNNIAPPGTTTSATFPVHGTITLTNINMGNGTVTNVFTSPNQGSNVNIGGVFYTGAVGINPDGSNAFAPPTVNGGTGSIGGFVIAGTPEPASAVMLGAGVLGIAGVGLFRRRKARA
jgi:hypothetical protein